MNHGSQLMGGSEWIRLDTRTVQIEELRLVINIKKRADVDIDTNSMRI
jgi:hypothetical protein